MREIQKYIKATIQDAQDVALLHKNGIPTGFLSQQSLSFLSALYTYLIENEIVYVAKVDDVIVGFVAGTLTTNGLYKEFLKENLGLLMLFAFKNIFSLSFIKKASETLFAPKKASLDDDESELPELLSIVVDDKFKGQGLGKQLLQAFEYELKKKSVSMYKVLVGSKLDANKFYTQSGFILKKDVELHKGDISHIYVKSL
ncbi:MAG: GNAT family N-acetyltransferase [Sulfurospirillaceae bacterium]|nr:GNAT family N-acetyltransferase [Sulfurospirillaceae bacterium]